MDINLDNIGLFGIFFLIFIETVFPPIPSEAVLTLAGFLTTSHLSFVGAIVSSTLGSIAGAMVLYYVGMKFSIDKLRKSFESGTLEKLGFKKKGLGKTLNFFEKYRDFAVLIGRCVPVVRSLISIPAGMTSMPISKFILLTTLGSFIWNTILITMGRVFGENRDVVLQALRTYSEMVVMVIVVIVVVFIIYRKRTRE